ncbi:PfkB family carbohydrate kinase [Arthrobacter sp. NA-172]|uniref:PfkB family carbohydrate kinase n=1 Tax=Arthrobacter sp. NA-172 TaxID=3367524 RepID=UPI0037551411
MPDSGPTLHRPIEAYVMGRLNIDLFALPVRTALNRAQSFERSLGGFAGNVGTALARLGVRTAVISRVGDDGHGTFAREFLSGEGVDTSSVSTDPYWPTPLAFLESWPPDRFPILYYRKPTAADLQITKADLGLDRIAGAPLLFVSGTGFCQQPSADATLTALEAHRHTTILDLDYRAALWPDPVEYRDWMARAVRHASIIVGNVEEVETSQVSVPPGVPLIVKRGAAGSTVHVDGTSTVLPPTRVDVINGLGAGDAFCAALGYGLLRERPLIESARFGNVAGAIVASRPSCSSSMPYEIELIEAVATASASSCQDRK